MDKITLSWRVRSKRNSHLLPGRQLLHSSVGSPRRGPCFCLSSLSQGACTHQSVRLLLYLKEGLGYKKWNKSATFRILRVAARGIPVSWLKMSHERVGRVHFPHAFGTEESFSFVRHCSTIMPIITHELLWRTRAWSHDIISMRHLP